MRILCLLGMHSWVPSQSAVYHSEAMRRCAIPTVRARRVCHRCTQLQERDEHCLGMNPPDYYYRWYRVYDRK
jgi:hypothetical protein